MVKVTNSTRRAARTRRLKKQIAATIERARHAAWEQAFRICATENPQGRSGAFIRWFNAAWQQAVRHG